MNPILYAKIGAAVALLVLAFYLGSLGPKAALERDHAAMAEATSKALLAQQRAAETEHARQQKVIDAYDATKDIPDPIVVGVAHRVYLLASGCRVPEAPAVAGGTPAPAPVPIGPSGVERALGKLIEASAADAEQMNAMIQFAK